jgi:hypothetical protein
MDKATTNFNAVRDGRRSNPFYVDVDLTSARTIAGNTNLILNIAGNSFYVDQDKTNGGDATVHFQDTSLNNSSVPFYVNPGFIANVPFTQLLIENVAQAGKRLRIIYGVDIDFQAGVNANINTTSVVIPLEYQSSFRSFTALAATSAEVIFLPAANVNGAYIWSLQFAAAGASISVQDGVLAKTSTPTSSSDGDIILGVANVAETSGPTGRVTAQLMNPVRLRAGLGLYYWAGGLQTSGMRSCLYSLI